MQSPVAIVLRVSVLLGCLGFLPLVAAGGFAAPAKLYSLAQSWLPEPSGSESLLAPHAVQLELPADTLQYRAVAFPGDTSSEETSELELAKVMPASYEYVLPPRSQDEIPIEAPQAWSETETELEPDRVSKDEQIFETGSRTEAVATDTLAEVEHRLRGMGATEVRLEPWGNAGQFYRFCVVIPLSGSAEVQRYFQAIGPNPDQAALDVLSQVTGSARN